MTTTLRTTTLRIVTLFTIASMLFATAASAAEPESAEFIASSSESGDTAVDFTLYYDPDEANTDAELADADLLINFPTSAVHQGAWGSTSGSTLTVGSTTVGPGGETGYASAPTDITPTAATYTSHANNGNAGDILFITDIDLVDGMNGITITGNSDDLNLPSTTDEFTVSIYVCDAASAADCITGADEERGIVMDLVSDSSPTITASITETFTLEATISDCDWSDMTTSLVYGCDGSFSVATNAQDGFTVSVYSDSATMDSASTGADLDAVSDDADIAAGTEAFGISVEAGDTATQTYLVNAYDNNAGDIDAGSVSGDCVEAGNADTVGDFSALSTSNKTLEVQTSPVGSAVEREFCVAAAIGSTTVAADDYTSEVILTAVGKF